jgi:hypothetical protein
MVIKETLAGCGVKEWEYAQRESREEETLVVFADGHLGGDQRSATLRVRTPTYASFSAAGTRSTAVGQDRGGGQTYRRR